MSAPASDSKGQLCGLGASVVNFRFQLLRTSTIFTLLVLAACGGGGDSGVTPPNDIGTLAYVVTECRDTADGFSERQALHILHSDRDVTVMETPGVGPYFPGFGGQCRLLTTGRFGDGSVSREAFQGVAVSPDGAAVVFEVSDDLSINPPLPLHLPQEQKGIFFVRADGSGLRSLGPPSRLPFFALLNGGGTSPFFSFVFSPDGRMITFADEGPDAAGNEAGQVITLDVGSAQRRQVTHLPPAVAPVDDPFHTPSVVNPQFINNQTIAFFTFAKPDRLNPNGKFVPFTVRSDGSEEPKAAPVALTLPGGVDFIPVITGDKPAAVNLNLPGEAHNANAFPGVTAITEVFAIDGPNLLQLTNFQRVDTFGEIVGVDRQNVFFVASANPPELPDSNPAETCQIFSIDRIGGNLRQLTQFSAGQHKTTNGCYFEPPPGCAVAHLTQDSKTRTLVFYSSCDPLGTNPLGGQVFSMHPDGSGLRQLTHTQGLVIHPGEVIGELPGPIAYGPYAP